MQLTPLRPRRRRQSAKPASVVTDASDRSAGLPAIAERIAGLIDGPVSEALVVLLTELYGDALTRILAAIGEAPAGEQILDRLCDDQLVGGLLVVHDLHPRSLAARVERALARLKHLSTQPVPLALDRIEDDVVYVRLAAATGPAARAAIARAIAEAAPEITRVCAEVEIAEDRTLHF
jgi:hypothetical protein